MEPTNGTSGPKTNIQTGYPQDNRAYGFGSHFENERPINWRKYFYLFLRNWYLFLITAGIGLGIAYFKMRYNIPQYQASARLIIEEKENTQEMVNQLRMVRYWRRQSDLANETAKLTSFSQIKRTVDSLKQEVFWTAHGRIRVRPLYGEGRFHYTGNYDSLDWYKGAEWYIDHINNEKYRFYREESLDTILSIGEVVNIHGWKFKIELNENSSHNTYHFVVNNPTSLSKQYTQKIRVDYDQDQGTILNLSSQGPVGEREVDFLNALCRVYILSELERKQTMAENTFNFIDDQIVVILDSLKKSENQLLAFKISNNVINLSREGEIAFERLKSFHEQRTELKLKENYYHYLKKYIEDRKDPQTIIAPTMTESGDQLLINAVQDLQVFYEERVRLELSVSENNPSINQVNERISAVRERILEIVNGLIENNQLTFKQLNTEEQAILDQLKTLPLSEQQLLNIKRKYDLYNQFYTFLLQKRAEAGIQKASTVSNVRFLDAARYDNLVTVGNQKRSIILIALLLGLFLPAVILILRDLLDQRIIEREDITHFSNIPIIGTMGHSKLSEVLDNKQDDNPAFIESLRRIRTNLSYTLREKGQNAILVTSSVSGEGKSFSAANLAAIFALNNRKVLLAGFDLRKPTLHRIFDIPGDIGITSYIIGDKDLSEIVFPSGLDNLFVMPSGPIPPNPAELIETEEVKALFAKMKKDYDYVIIDSPPVALVADALSIAPYADLTLYLVRQNHSRREVLEVANAIYNENKLPHTYLLINDIQPSKSFGLSYYYGYGKDYSYGYYSYKNTKKGK